MLLQKDGSYSYNDVAWLTRLRRRRVREWFEPRPTTKLGAVFFSDYAGRTEQTLVSFFDLVDVFIAGQLREHGVALQTIRRSYRSLQGRLHVEHPFCHKGLLTDGKQLFIDSVDSRGQQEISEALTGQKCFPKIIRPFLKRLDYSDASNLATKWRIASGVMVDPAICFGKPVVSDHCIPTYVLADSYSANKRDAEAVADWYGVTATAVRRAVQFETNHAA